MGIYLATVKLPTTSGLPEDDVDNDFTWESDDPTDDAADAITTALSSFYNTVQTVPGTDRSIANFLNEGMSRTTNGVTIDFYDITETLDGSPHGSPVATRNFTLGAASASQVSLPSEVAVKLSIHGDLAGIPEQQTNPTPPPLTIRPAARRRGGVYLGALGSYTIDQSDNGNRAHVGTNFIDVICAAAETLIGAVDAGLRVWSRTDAAVYPVEGYYVDDAFDTIRKRGFAAIRRQSAPA